MNKEQGMMNIEGRKCSMRKVHELTNDDWEWFCIFRALLFGAFPTFLITLFYYFYWVFID
ncbi:hypothetical protein SY85_01620 [Flavisolibacter tropicus]|uniref:Uncharacterized protein n=1 Tax=Flavisolibacter tropicus TaxID=1492898 RepID=A0A172TQY2_9BACT|nr:hypothetical protein SY85_01620 [Flavisolibacter tropicus]